MGGKRVILWVMISRTHEAGAFLTLIAATVYYSPNDLSEMTVLAALIANIIGALLPDIDQASNRLWDLLPGGNLIGKIFRNLFLSHRTISHSLLGLGLAYFINQWLLFRLFNNQIINPKYVFQALLIGYGSHLFLDGLTEEGIPLLFPIKWKFGWPPIKSWRIKSGKWFENWVVFPIILGATIYIGIKYGRRLVELIF